jgi:predicted DCC family thiol-disulfide oxidoreductase YuxK
MTVITRRCERAAVPWRERSGLAATDAEQDGGDHQDHDDEDDQHRSGHTVGLPGVGYPNLMIVLWDRDCGFCAFMLSLVLRADRRRRLKPMPIQSPDGERLLADMPVEQRLASWHFIDDHGRRTSGGEALTELLRHLPGGRVPAALTGALPGVTEGAYGWVATHRRLLSRPIPSGFKERARRLVAARSA